MQHTPGVAYQGDGIDRIQLLEKLSAFPILLQADTDTLDQLLSVSKYLQLPSDCLVYEQHEAGDSMFIVLEGRLVEWVESADNRSMTLGYFRSNDFFGELCVLSPGARPTNVRTCADCELLSLDFVGVHQLIGVLPGLMRWITTSVAQRARAHVELLQSTAFRSARQRVMAALLVICADAQRAPRANGETIDDATQWAVVSNYSRAEIAAMSATSRETVCRTLGELARKGALDRGSRGGLAVRPASVLALLGADRSKPNKHDGPVFAEDQDARMEQAVG